MFFQQTQFSLWDLLVVSIVFLPGGCIFILGGSGTTVGLKKEREIPNILLVAKALPGDEEEHGWHLSLNKFKPMYLTPQRERAYSLKVRLHGECITHLSH